MPEQQLNLLELAAALAAEHGVGAAQVMGREFAKGGGAGVMDDHLPNSLGGRGDSTVAETCNLA